MASLARLFAALTLVIAAFVVVPVSDAAACAPEPVAAHQAFDHDPAAGDHNGPGGEHGLCAHGHCHHTASERHATSEFGLAEAFVQTRHGRPQDDGVASFAANGLMRPPRS